MIVHSHGVLQTYIFAAVPMLTVSILDGVLLRQAVQSTYGQSCRGDCTGWIDYGWAGIAFSILAIVASDRAKRGPGVLGGAPR